ncbi:unnamed protein product, partial [Mesorhabditis belari]|uniref:tRNA-intron lyase n=1 Tax=Mesorhabditis belari TaxID=2138241 RepID=A0AAF3F0L5_9BILA
MSTDEVDKRVNIAHIEGKFFVHETKELDKLKNLRIVPMDFNRGSSISLFTLYGLLPEIVHALYELNLVNFVSPEESPSKLDVLLGYQGENLPTTSQTEDTTALEANNPLSKCDETISTSNFQPTIQPQTVEFFPDSAGFYARSKIFRDLWINGYYVTCGQKFGCHYLAYEESPDSVHSSYMVWCLDNSRNADFLSHLPVLQRVATQTCKKILLATTNPDADVPHYSLIERFTGLDRLKRVDLEESSDFKKRPSTNFGVIL